MFSLPKPFGPTVILTLSPGTISVVKDPVRRGNTGDNTPAMIYTEIVPGDSCCLSAKSLRSDSKFVYFLKHFFLKVCIKWIRILGIQWSHNAFFARSAHLSKVPPIPTPTTIGGKTTAIGLNIETMPTHIAGMPCAVNINCHVTRHKSEVI